MLSINCVILLLLYWPWVKCINDESNVDEIKNKSDTSWSVKVQNDDIEKLSNINKILSSQQNSNFFADTVIPSLPQLDADRRVFNASTALRKEFELLKINDKTPAVANYQEFYKNLQSNMNENYRGVSKETEKYLNTIEKPNYENYYFNGNSKDTLGPSATTFQQEKVRSNYHQHASASGYDIFGENVTQEKTSSLAPATYDNSEMTSRQTHSSSMKQTLKSRPFVTPKSYEINIQYGYQPSITPESTTYNYQGTSEDRYDKSDDYSMENFDYYEMTERPRRVHKLKKKPFATDNYRKLVKEHRGVASSDHNDLSKLSTATKSKVNRGKPKFNQWNNENYSQSSDPDSSEEGSSKVQAKSPSKRPQEQLNTWNQLTPNVEISQSNGYEVNQIDKPSVLVPVNFLPVSQFDQSTKSHAYDVNSGITNFVTAGPIVSTAVPLISSNPPIVMTPTSPTKTMPGIINANYAYSTSVPDIIIGQNSFQNSGQTLLMPDQSQNKYIPLGKTYFHNAVSPMFAVSSTMQSPTANTNSLNSPINVPQLYYSSSTLQPIIQSPNPSTNYNILVNPHGLYGQNVQQRASDNQTKKNIQGTDGQFLAGASFSVGHNQQMSNINENKFYIPVNNDNNIIKSQQLQSFIQATPSIGVLNQSFNPQNHGNFNNPIFDSLRNQLQSQQPSSSSKIQYQQIYGSKDSLGSTSNNNVNAFGGISVVNGGQIQALETPIVQIHNPGVNMKPSPVDMSSYYPSVVTTSMPILSADNFVNRQAGALSLDALNLQKYVNSLTQYGTQNNPSLNTVDQRQNVYNPINFVPNVDLINSQSFLNGKLADLPPNLNLVPMVPQGKYFNRSPTSQTELETKPKLSSDLEKFAEEMFKESVRTIYNTHKWNTENKSNNFPDSSDKLKSELERFKASLTAAKYGKDVLEAHHSENRFQTTEPGRKRPGLSLAALEELFKTEFKLNGDSESINSRPGVSIKLNDYLTPPKIKSFTSKSPFHDKTVKKRPGKTIRTHRPGSLDVSASNHVPQSHRRPLYTRNVVTEYRKLRNFDVYPTFTTSSPKTFRHSTDFQESKSDQLDMNHPRTHNLLGYLMKSKQLPGGTSFRDEEEFKQFFENDRRRIHQDKRFKSLHAPHYHRSM